MENFIRKTDYLKESKNILFNGLLNIGEDIQTEDPFKKYPEYINNLYNKLPKVTEEGTEVTLANTRKGKMVIMPKGNTSQESTQGIQLFVYPYYETTITRDGITFTVKSDGIIHVQGTATAKTSFTLRNRDLFLNINEGDTYTLVASGLGVVDSTVWLDTAGQTGNFLDKWVLQASSNYATAVAQSKDKKPLIKITVENGATINTDIQILLYKGSYDSSKKYEPYTGGQPSPNPDYPQEIKVVKGKNKVIVIGKNLLEGIEYGDVNSNTGVEFDSTTTIRSKNYIPYELNTMYYPSVNDDESSVGLNLRMYNKNKEYIGYAFLSKAGSQNFSITKTTSVEDDTPKFFKFRIGASSFDVENDKVMIATNSDLTYEPYIEPKEFDLDLTSKNKFDINNITENTFINEQGQTGSSQVTDLSDFIKIIDNNKYTLSYDYTTLLNSNIRSIVYYDENKNFISGRSYSPVYKTLTVTTPNNAQYLRFSYDKNCYNILLEESPTATPYEPYYNYELAGIGENKDYIYKENGKWYKKEYISKVILNGSEENWRADNNNKLYGLNLSNCKLNTSTSSSQGLCDKFIVSGLTQTRNFQQYFAIYGGSTNTVSVWFNNRNKTLEEWKTWVSNNNLKVYHQLENPTDIEITDTTLIEQLEELNRTIIPGGTIVIETESEEENAQLIVKASALKSFSN